jgi:hypothetical protein
VHKRIHDESNLGLINDLIHDTWFDVDAIALNTRDNTVVIPIRTRKERVSGKAASNQQELALNCLQIHNVIELEIEDTERVGIYDFNELVFEPHSKLVTITTGVPLHLRIKVSDLDISCDRGDESVLEGDKLLRSAEPSDCDNLLRPGKPSSDAGTLLRPDRTEVGGDTHVPTTKSLRG